MLVLLDCRAGGGEGGKRRLWGGARVGSNRKFDEELDLLDNQTILEMVIANYVLSSSLPTSVCGKYSLTF